MRGTYLIATHDCDGNPVHLMRRGEIIKNGDCWFGITREKAEKSWIITELSSGLKTHRERIATKTEAVERAKSSEFLELVQNMMEVKNNDYTPEMVEKIKKHNENARKLCLDAYCDKKYDNDAELNKTARKVFSFPGENNTSRNRSKKIKKEENKNHKEENSKKVESDKSLKGENKMSKNYSREIKYEIVECIGVISTQDSGWQKELNMISWGENPPKYDIRDWSPDHTRMSKGTTLDESQIEALYNLLKQHLKEAK